MKWHFQDNKWNKAHRGQTTIEKWRKDNVFVELPTKTTNTNEKKVLPLCDAVADTFHIYDFNTNINTHYMDSEYGKMIENC
jgi:hypothetical protein